MQDDRLGHFHRGRHQIIREACRTGSCHPARRRIPRRTPRRAPARSRRVTWPADHAGMQQRAAIVHGDVSVDPHARRCAVHLDAAEVEDETVAERSVDLVVIVRRGQFGRSPEYGLADASADLVRHSARRPMAGGGERAKTARTLSGLPRAQMRPPSNTTSLGRDVELLCGDARELVAQSSRRRDARRRRPRRRSGWNNCRTRSTKRRLAVSSSTIDADVCGLRPSTSATTCATPCDDPDPRPDATCTATPPSGSTLTVAVACAPLFGPALRRSSASAPS